MPKKTITKFSVFVIFIVFVSISSGACHSNVVGGGEPPSFDRAKSLYDEPKVVGKIESTEITESSGIAVSKCQQEVIWTHNDSEDGAFIFALNSTGKALGTWRVPNARNVDWEDMAGYKNSNGKCYLYVGDIGNTNNNERSEHKIYRIPEPAVNESDSGATRKDPIQTEPAETLTFSYPDARQDAETLMVHPASGEIYIVTKHRSSPAGVYKLKPVFDAAVVKADKISDLTVPAIPNGFLTGGDIAHDGKHLIVSDYFAAYEFTLPADSGNFDDIWKQKPVVVELGERKQGEAIGYAEDGLSIYATSEGKLAPLIEAKRRKQK